MKKIFQEAKKSNEIIKNINLTKKEQIKLFILTIGCCFLIAIPVILIAYSSFQISSPITWGFWITIVFIGIAVLVISAMGMVLYTYLLKEKAPTGMEEVNLKAIFISELLSPFTIIMVIVIIIFLTIIL